MKIMKITVLLMAFFASSTFAQITKFEKVDTSTAIQTNDLVNAYYGIKDALVATDGKKTSTEAKNFLVKLEAIDQNKMTAEQKSFFKPLNEKMSSDAKHMSNSQDASEQREKFEGFSNNVLAFVKAFGSSEDVFVQYCPMAKKSWLSNVKAVKNPYYGSKMLTCGKVTETISKK